MGAVANNAVGNNAVDNNAVQQLRLRSDTVTWQDVGPETVLLSLRSASYFGVNAAGTVLWSALAQGTTRDELIATLAGQFDLQPAVATRDVDEFLAACGEHELLEAR